MSDSTRRAIRTVFDVVPALLAALAVLVPVLELDAGTIAKIGLILGALTVAFAKLRNGLEDAGVIPAVLKAPPSRGANPVPDVSGGYVGEHRRNDA